MATVIDALVVTLGLDMSQFSAGTAKAAKEQDKMRGSVDKTSKEVTKSSRVANDHARQLDNMARQGVKAFNDVKNAAIQMFASYTTATGLERLITNLTNANADLGLMSKNLGISSTEIKAWSNAAEQMGGSAAGTQKDVASLTKSMTDFKQTGNYSEMLSGLAAMGVGIQDAQGHAKSATQVMLDLSDRVKGMSRPDAYAYISNHVGMDEGTINLILQGSDALKAQLEAQKANAAAAAANAEKSQKLRAEVAKVKQKFEEVANELLSKLTPYLIKLAEWMEKNGDVIVKLAVGLGTLLIAISALKAVGIVVTLFKGFFMIGSGIVKFLPLMARGFLMLFGPIGLVVGVIAALAVGLIYAYNHFDTFKNGVDGTWLKLKEFANNIEEKVKPVFEWLGDVLGKIWSGDFKGAVSMVVTGVTKTVVSAAKSVIDTVAGSNEGKAVKEAAGNAKSGYHEGSTGVKTEGANESSMSYKAGKAVGKGRSFVFGGGVDDYIKEAAEKYKLDESVLRGFVKMEAGWKGAMSPTGAIGTGQFVKKTWDGLAETRDGQAIGMTKIGSRFRTAADPRHDKRINTLATGLLAKQNADLLRKNGLSATGENLYMLHNIGPGVIPALKGSDNVSSDTRLAMDQNGGRGKSATQFVEYQKKNYNRHYAEANGERAIVGAKSKPVPALPTGAQASRPVALAATQTRNNTSTSEVNIQQLIVQTKATDAQGIASNLSDSLRNQNWIGQSNTGLS